jgi:hypothetical protein
VAIEALQGKAVINNTDKCFEEGLQLATTINQQDEL